MEPSGPRVQFEIFKSSFDSWNLLFQEAATYAETVGRDRLIGISHSCDSSEGVVTVWYWSDPGDDNPGSQSAG